jgi:hypothetical protein
MQGEEMRRGVFIAVFLVLAFKGAGYAYNNGDFHVWNNDYEEFKVGKKTKVILEQEFRWGNSGREFYYQHYDGGVFYDLLNWLNVGGGYRQIYEKSGGRFHPCEEPYLTLTLSGILKGFKLDDRSRMEYNDYDYKDDFWRYRNKLTIKAPWKFTKLEIQPYISDEIFIVFGGLPERLNQNRFSAGFDMNLVKHVKVGLYYMLQTHKKSSKWYDYNVLGTKLRLVF